MDFLSLLAGIDNFISLLTVYHYFAVFISLAILGVFSKNINPLMVIFIILLPMFSDVMWGAWRYFSDDFQGSIFSLLGIDIPGYVYYLISALSEFITIFLLLYRKNITILLIKLWLKIKVVLFIKTTEVNFGYQRHINEFKIVALFAASIVLNALTSAEYLIRYLYDKQWLYLYYSYSSIQIILSTLMVYYVFCIVCLMRKTNVEGVMEK